jgi:hypothetical protein
MQLETKIFVAAEEIVCSKERHEYKINTTGRKITAISNSCFLI